MKLPRQQTGPADADWIEPRPQAMAASPFGRLIKMRDGCDVSSFQRFGDFRRSVHDVLSTSERKLAVSSETETAESRQPISEPIDLTWSAGAA